MGETEFNDKFSYLDAAFANDEDELTDLDRSFTSIIRHTSGRATVQIWANCSSITVACKSYLHAEQVVMALRGKFLGGNV